MEENRLKPMPVGYNEKVFNQIYKETAALRRKLAFNIDPRKFGVDYYEVLSWFDVKFIHAFNKYYGKMDDNILKGHIINSLQFFKCRIVRASYNKKAEINNSNDFLQIQDLQDSIPLEDTQTESNFLDKTTDYFRKQLSKDGYILFDLSLNPPLYIINKLSSKEKLDINRIPNDVIIDYLGLQQEAIPYITNLRKEVRKVTRQARNHFQNHPIAV